ncbi:hypothetical protein G3I15_18270, partial [Streptomyces sp. SID10244]|nr:hypothetical protein [Streptomyces sp. SID10244]
MGVAHLNETLTHANNVIRQATTGNVHPVTAELRTRTIHVNGIDMSITEQGSGVPVILCHGFPGLGFSWRHQIPA